MRNDKLVETKNLLNSINFHDEAESLEEILSDSEYLKEEIEYLRTVRKDAEQAMNTLTGDEFLKYSQKYNALTRVMENILIFA